jgi:hypothetical protein
MGLCGDEGAAACLTQLACRVCMHDRQMSSLANIVVANCAAAMPCRHALPSLCALRVEAHGSGGNW